MPRIERFLSEVKGCRVPQTLWTYSEAGHTQEAKKELISLVDFPNSEVVFNTPKPTRLTRRILQLTTKPEEPEAQKGAPIRVSFFDDRIEIENSGILLPGLTFDDIRQGVSKLRNRVIAHVFRELDLIEQWGSGIRRIFEEAEQLGLAEPQMIEIGMRVRFIVYLAQPFTPGNSNPQPPMKTESTEQVTEQVKRLFFCLREQPLSIREIMQSLKLRHRPKLLYDYLKPAMDGGFVEMTQPDSPKSPTQKYRLTKKGERLSNET